MTAEGSVSALCQREPAPGYAMAFKAYDTLACVHCNVTILLLKRSEEHTSELQSP